MTVPFDVEKFVYVDLRDEGATYLRQLGLEWVPDIARWVDPVSFEHLKTLSPRERETWIRELIESGPTTAKESPA